MEAGVSAVVCAAIVVSGVLVTIRVRLLAGRGTRDWENWRAVDMMGIPHANRSNWVSFID